MKSFCILIGLSTALGQVPSRSVDTATDSLARPSATKSALPRQDVVAQVPPQAAPPKPKVVPKKSPPKKPVPRSRSKKRPAKTESQRPQGQTANPVFVEVPEALVRPKTMPLIAPDRQSELYRFGWLLVSGLLLFLLNRLISRSILRASRDERAWALIAVRAWPLLELVIWIAVSLWCVAYYWGTQNNFVLYTLVGVVLLVLATQWNVLRDVAAGLVFAAERSFEVGEVVRIGNAEGQLRRLRLRHLEIETNDGRLSQIPYRAAIGTTDVRAGGSSVAHTVQLDLDIPSAVDPKQALDAVLEMAASSPWSVIGLRPRVDLQANPAGASVIRVEAYAFDREVKPSLHADMLSGWKEIVKSLSDAPVRKL